MNAQPRSLSGCVLLPSLVFLQISTQSTQNDGVRVSPGICIQSTVITAAVASRCRERIPHTAGGSGKPFSAQHAEEQANNSLTATTSMEHPHLDLD
ncbi:hypothetical protein PROFUN_04950 [Planoprotostelium fungivorum]|uniref:Secreted protein n=1 Tax=Planoprotostelium fungivorum TaxID=1890364 RepID=A0A2P6NSV7_9EUKA|nr:hypothetical protein PROFUN_04950 [Planoprotostelium fungivorum]